MNLECGALPPLFLFLPLECGVFTPLFLFFVFRATRTWRRHYNCYTGLRGGATVDGSPGF
jgi:hypothetical protein